MKRYAVRYTRMPTNYHDTHVAVVEAETPELALELLKHRLGDQHGMTQDEILRGIEAMQKIQSQNPPSSNRWQRASRVLHELIRELTGNYPKDACGRDTEPNAEEERDHR